MNPTLLVGDRNDATMSKTALEGRKNCLRWYALIVAGGWLKELISVGERILMFVDIDGSFLIDEFEINDRPMLYLKYIYDIRHTSTCHLL